MASDTIQALADILLEPDGKLKDLSDKKGRLKLLDAITNNCAKQDETKVLMFKLPQSIAKVIPAKVNAELCDDDRKRIDNLQAHYFKVFLLGIASAILFGFLFVITVYKSWKFNDVKEQHELYYKHKQEIIDFGKYIKNRYPDTFTSWEETRQRATEDGDN
ncbi:hypothetical protein PRLR5107_27650 [Prevotella lacticifex]|uniref:Uncharacterized protein n=2 Tax=Prevotella lacticifex TaxID=2854755 RepID=A0A9R1C8R8_9BACT|nr:hypothetical protein [Prevotella lacticifex]GJG37882.1 hypothetical protein PRLR5003_30390 [Prevotella lacticifex]GJG41162.1 hypothetical protein PRLR5019_31330 [Prevotella lacticifex]GJG43365.1 hypothetical protein PRLR5025_21510 [Prevotella lacticifex]GJG47147.1 hypothetical protein PRLR5027_27420 [Prevotella lacticifex]GJG50202.1 hypothetical protein PRLR5052_26150 [Prevotella lacticifex]